MKKVLFMLSLLILFTLSACSEEILFDYSDFEDITIHSHAEAEDKSNNKYIVYYYQETCSHCQDVKQEILGFADEYEGLDFYIFDTSKATDNSTLSEFIGTPTVFVFSGEEIIESYIGGPNVSQFISLYSGLELTYATFGAQNITIYDDLLNIESDVYLVYYYLETCPNCIAIKDQFLAWAFTKNVSQIYLMNGASVTDPDNLPTELQILSSGTPLLIVMNNGVFADEYYSGKDDILDFIELNGTLDID